MDHDLQSYLDKCDDNTLKIINNYINNKLIINDTRTKVTNEKYIQYRTKNLELNNKYLDFKKIEKDLDLIYNIRIGSIHLKGKLKSVSEKKKNSSIECYYDFKDNPSHNVSHVGGSNTMEKDFIEINARGRVDDEIETLKNLILQKIIILSLMIKSM